MITVVAQQQGVRRLCDRNQIKPATALRAGLTNPYLRALFGNKILFGDSAQKIAVAVQQQGVRRLCDRN